MLAELEGIYFGYNEYSDRSAYSFTNVYPYYSFTYP